MNWQYNDHRWGKKPTSFGSAVLRLLGHLFRSALVFTAIFSFSWGIGFVFHTMNAIFPFDADEASAIRKIHFGLLYFDFALSVFVLFAGAKRFAKDMGVLP